MGIARLKNLAGGGVRDYYHEGKDDYYRSESVEPEFIGSGLGMYGLDGDISVEQFEALNMGANGHQRKAKDLTLSPPKSVSLMFAAGDEKQSLDALEAHRQAVRETIDYIERSGMVLTRTRDGEIVHNTEARGLVIASFEHATNRNQDPNLHSHCLIANACTAGKGDQPVNLNFREIYRNQKHLSQVYDSALINAFNERGYDIREKGKTFELAGVTDEQIEAFSTRREDIEKALKVKGLSYELASDEERQYACFATRRKKVSANKAEMVREWEERANKVNLSFGTTKTLNNSPTNKKLEYVQEAFKEAAELDGIFTAKSVYAKAIKKAREDGYGISPREVEELFNAESVKDGAISIPDQESKSWIHHRITTIDLVQAERDLCERLRQQRGQFDPLMPDSSIEEELSQYNDRLLKNSGFKLNQEQAEMVHHILGNQDLTSIVQGDAGTGKTTALDAVGAILGKEKVTGLAIQSSAARNLENETGIASQNIDQFFKDVESQKQKTLDRLDGGLIVVDEAAMVDSRKMERVTAIALEYNSRISLVGDTKQLAAVGAGKPMEMIMKRDLGAVHNLADIRRQKDEEQRAIVKEIAKGEGGANIIKSLDNLGLIQVHKTKEKRHEAIAKEALAHWKRGEPSLVITSLNQDKDSLNRKIRLGLQRKGLLPDGRDQTVELQARNNKSISRALVEGDRVVCNRNSKKLQIENGNLATVLDVHAKSNTIRLKMDKNGRTKTIDLNDYKSIDYAYALTTYSSQGKTVRKCIYDASSKSPLLSKNEFYVAISRHKEDVKVYTDDKEGMARKISSKQSKECVFDYFENELVEKCGISSDEKLQKPPFALEATDKAISVSLKNNRVNTLDPRLEKTILALDLKIIQLRGKQISRIEGRER